MNLGSNSRGFNRENPFGMRAKVGRAGEGDYVLRGDKAGEEVEVEEEESSREDDIFVKEEEEDDDEEYAVEYNAGITENEYEDRGELKERKGKKDNKKDLLGKGLEESSNENEGRGKEGELRKERGDSNSEEEEEEEDDDNDGQEEGDEEEDDDGDGENEEENEESGEEDEDDDDDDSDDSGDEETDSESESSGPKQPVVAAVKEMQFRSSRGTRINYLMAREKLEAQADDFWKENKYFGSKKYFLK